MRPRRTGPRWDCGNDETLSTIIAVLSLLLPFIFATTAIFYYYYCVHRAEEGAAESQQRMPRRQNPHTLNARTERRYNAVLGNISIHLSVYLSHLISSEPLQFSQIL